MHIGCVCYDRKADVLAVIWLFTWNSLLYFMWTPPKKQSKCSIFAFKSSATTSGHNFEALVGRFLTFPGWILKSNLDIKEPSFLNSATQIDRRKTLTENCPAYLKQTGQKAVEGNSLAAVASSIARKLTTRYFPRFRAIYCIQHKAGTTNFNRFLNEIKHNSTDKMSLTEVHYGIPFLINNSFE